MTSFMESVALLAATLGGDVVTEGPDADSSNLYLKWEDRDEVEGSVKGRIFV
jgi:hypothetical protein